MQAQGGDNCEDLLPPTETCCVPSPVLKLYTPAHAPPAIYNFEKETLGRLREVYLNLVKPELSSSFQEVQEMEGQSKQHYEKAIRSRMWDAYKTTGLISNKINVTYKEKEMALN